MSVAGGFFNRRRWVGKPSCQDLGPRPLAVVEVDQEGLDLVEGGVAVLRGVELLLQLEDLLVCRYDLLV